MQNLINLLLALIGAILSFLPDSPFNFDRASEFADIMGYINYFIPIGTFLKILAGWLTAIGAYYVYSLILRWIKAIE